MSRWSLLKSALAGGGNENIKHASIHRFKGFELCRHNKIIWLGFKLSISTKNMESLEEMTEKIFKFMEDNDTCECTVSVSLHAPELEEKLHTYLATILNTIAHSRTEQDDSKVYTFLMRHKTLQPILRLCEYSINSFEITNERNLSIYTREKPRNTGLKVSALLSNQLHNVDNTGNVCVWPSESILLHTLLTVPFYLKIVKQAKSIIELGGGMTALAGLGLAASGMCTADIVVTDGHPDCITNQKVCLQMNRQMDTISHGYPVRVQRLHWTAEHNSDDMNVLTSSGTAAFDLIVASDCLFFRDFHDDLLQTILKLLSPTGTVLLLQPRRDGTMNQFAAKCEPYFDIRIDENYNATLTAMKEELLRGDNNNTSSDTDNSAAFNNSGYTEDIHYPIMMILIRGSPVQQESSQPS